jgi:hypothetical protein
MVDMGWPGKAEAGHASRSSGLVQITAARCANGFEQQPLRLVRRRQHYKRSQGRRNLNASVILAWRNGDGGRANGDGGLRDVDATRDMYHVVRMINTSTHTITHMKMPYSYTRQAPLLRFSEFRLSARAQTVNEIRDSRNVTTPLSLASVYGKWL